MTAPKAIAENQECTERLSRVLARSQYVWDDREQAFECMGKPHLELHGATPFDIPRTEPGARRVEEPLDKLYFGLAA